LVLRMSGEKSQGKFTDLPGRKTPVRSRLNKQGRGRISASPFPHRTGHRIYAFSIYPSPLSERAPLGRQKGPSQGGEQYSEKGKGGSDKSRIGKFVPRGSLQGFIFDFFGRTGQPVTRMEYAGSCFHSLPSSDSAFAGYMECWVDFSVLHDSSFFIVWTLRVNQRIQGPQARLASGQSRRARQEKIFYLQLVWGSCPPNRSIRVSTMDRSSLPARASSRRSRIASSLDIAFR